MTYLVKFIVGCDFFFADNFVPTVDSGFSLCSNRLNLFCQAGDMIFVDEVLCAV